MRGQAGFDSPRSWLPQPLLPGASSPPLLPSQAARPCLPLPRFLGGSGFLQCLRKGTPRGRPGSLSRMPLTQAAEGPAAALESLSSLPDISWFKGRQPVSARKGVTVSPDGRVLLIERARFSDSGSYRCVASSVAGHTELQYGLRVNGELPWDSRRFVQKVVFRKFVYQLVGGGYIDVSRCSLYV